MKAYGVNLVQILSQQDKIRKLRKTQDQDLIRKLNNLTEVYANINSTKVSKTTDLFNTIENSLTQKHNVQTELNIFDEKSYRIQMKE